MFIVKFLIYSKSAKYLHFLFSTFPHRLTELGPRLKLELVKIEEGICEGQVMYHAFVNKTEAELAHQKAMKDKKRFVLCVRKHQVTPNKSHVSRISRQEILKCLQTGEIIRIKKRFVSC